MHTRNILTSIFFLRTASVSASDYSPFADPLFGLSEDTILLKRQGCQGGLDSCSGLGSNLCCPSGTTCSLDQAGHVACCSQGAVCTGTIGGSVIGSVTGSTTSGIVIGGGGITSTVTSSGSVATITQGGSAGSTVPNTYYPFFYAPTSFADAGQCSSAFTSCQTASTACFTSLAGSYGVTIGGFGGGITVQGVSGQVLSAASTICSSLSSVACSNLPDVSQCSNLGGGSGVTPTTISGSSGSTGGIIQVGNDSPRQTACAGILYAAGAGAVIGAMHGVI